MVEPENDPVSGRNTTNTMHKAQVLILCAVLIASTGACLPARISHVATETTVPSTLTRYPGAQLAIAPFTNPSGSQQLGAEIARGFATHLTARSFFSRIALLSAPQRLIPADSALITTAAVQQAREQGCDFVLLGKVAGYQPGDASASRVTIAARVIRLGDGAVVWHAQAGARGLPGKTFLFWDHQLAACAPQPEAIAARVIADLSADMLPRRWLPRLRRKTQPEPPAPDASPGTD